MENFVFPDEIFKNDEKNWKHFSRPLKFWESAAGCTYILSVLREPKTPFLFPLILLSRGIGSRPNPVTNNC